MQIAAEAEREGINDLRKSKALVKVKNGVRSLAENQSRHQGLNHGRSDQIRPTKAAPLPSAKAVACRLLPGLAPTNAAE
ncbi:MAG: hypothetical protein IPO08_09210 [Xanthomonadales bacterium]|nr:hypothetical protein [Xanthomonadales bacterium]